jgi:chromatin remodeling complex protein RSC6
MVRTAKSATAPTTPVSAPVVEASAPKAPRAKKVAAPKVEAVVAPVDAAAQPVVAPVADVAGLPLKMTEFSAKLQQMSGLFASVKGDFKTLEKVVSRELKNAQKSKSKSKKASGNRQPSGFVKPTRLSDELAKFLGKAAGVEMARTAVSKEINAYIREKGLQDASNGRKINPDASLTKLLNLKKEDELTYFNLQRYMKHHFIKAVPVATA